MKKKTIFACLAACLVSLAQSAGAAENPTGASPMLLSDSDMDAVSAGAQTSEAWGFASALFGIASSNSEAATYSAGPVYITTASSLNYAFGVDPQASAYANSRF